MRTLLSPIGTGRRAPPTAGPAARLRRLPGRLGLLAAGLLITVPALAQQQYWYDGSVRRPLWAESGVVADFSGPTREKSQVVVPGTLAKATAGTHSPVFRDHAREGGAARALPGGVLLRFRPGTDAATRQALLARHRLSVQREIGQDGSTWLIDSAPGEASLALANRLFESGDFEAASPNWWQARRLK